MSLLNVLTFPDPFLKTKAKEIKEFDQTLKKLSQDMLETMYEENGIGLAAIQVGIDLRLIVVDVEQSEENKKGNPIVLVNPKIIEKNGETSCEEGCLSVPEYRAEVKRAQQVKVQFQDVLGEVHEIKAENLLSICIQHEIDHLDGVLFIDYLSPLKQKMVKKKLKKLSKFSA